MPSCVKCSMLKVGRPLRFLKNWKIKKIRNLYVWRGRSQHLGLPLPRLPRGSITMCSCEECAPDVVQPNLDDLLAELWLLDRERSQLDRRRTALLAMVGSQVDQCQNAHQDA